MLSSIVCMNLLKGEKKPMLHKTSTLQDYVTVKPKNAPGNLI